MGITRFLRVVQRHPITIDESQAFLLPIFESLFLIETHMTFNERLLLFHTAANLRSGFVACEVGSYLGASTAILAVAASLRGGRVHAVDTWKNDAMPNEQVIDTFAEFQKNIEPYRHPITIHRGNARDLRDRVPALDLLFLDGDHSYEGVLADLQDYAPKLHPGGMLVFHDFHMESVRQAASDYLQNQLPKPLAAVGSLHVYQIHTPKKS